MSAGLPGYLSNFFTSTKQCIDALLVKYYHVLVERLLKYYCFAVVKDCGSMRVQTPLHVHVYVMYVWNSMK